MATLLLSAAGSAIGGQIGGTVLGVSAATIGQAAGAVAGGLIDQRLLGSGSRAVTTGRARSLRIQSSTPGAPMPRVFGRMRVAGQLIWSSRFLETVRTTSQGGKGGGGGSTTVNEYAYSISFAVALSEGRIDRIGRIWADGKLLELTDLQIRWYPGDDTQLPDPKIEAVEGAGTVPAFRGTAYVVFEDLPVGPFGNRIPQITVEVFRSVERRAEGPEAGAPLPELIQGVALSPGTGEFALDPEPAHYAYALGGSASANIHTHEQRPDILVALDDLQASLPACGTVSLVVSWFGSDLRCGRCRVEPKVEAKDRTAAPEPWEVSGVDLAAAAEVTQDDGRPVYGGTPSDGSVIRAIREMKARGLKVMLYPFLLMDIPAGNGLTDPYGGAEQPAFPWRGRITLDAAPGEAGSTDKTASAASDVAAFFGTSAASDFAVEEDAVTYSGPAEFTWRRFALHIAALGAAAGGVDAICIASEMRGLTTIRDGATTYPAVDQLINLAAEVRALLPDAKISYAADWSEYFGHQPADGSGDRFFHLDPFWADANVDFIGIDDYLPLSDWRHAGSHLDQALAPSVYSLPYLSAGVESGEHYDYFYADDAARDTQTRTPIDDTAHGEHWVFRPKDIRGWWENAHHNRPGGTRDASPTAWVPRSKPVWLTETGCPAVDLGANKPNLFYDPKSSESGLPPSSAGARDDEMQRRFLQAKLGYWAEAANNPTGTYGGPMIPTDRIYVWTWDARPFPDFPMRESVWSDGSAHQLGHWITGRVGNASLADVIHEISVDAGVTDVDVSQVWDAVHGYLIEDTDTARAALQPLMLAYGVDARETGGTCAFAMRGMAAPVAVSPDRAVESDDRLGAIVRTRAPEAELPGAVRLSYLEAEGEYRSAAAEARAPDADAESVAESSLALAFPASRAQRIADRWLAEAVRARDGVTLALPPSMLALEAADVISLAGPGGEAHYRVDRVVEAGAREIEAVRIEASTYRPVSAPERRLETGVTPPPGPLTALLMELPLAEGQGQDHEPHVATFAEPWPGAVAVHRSPGETDFRDVAQVRVPALMGHLITPLPAGRAETWQRVTADIALPSGALTSTTDAAVLNGANGLAVEAAPGQWEILQVRDAELLGENYYRCVHFLRGRRGTEHLATSEIAAGARVVVLDAAVVRVPTPLELRGLPRHYRIGPATRAVDHQSYLAFEQTVEGVGLRPFAPAHLRAVRTATGDLSIRWIRRTRLGGDSWEGADVPLGEEREAYRLQVWMGGSLLRTAETTAPAFTYLSTDQVSDGASGTIEIRVAQLSTTFGYGLEKGIIVHV